MVTTRYWLRGVEERLLIETKKGLAHTQKKCHKKPDIHESKEKDSSTSSFKQSS